MKLTTLHQPPSLPRERPMLILIALVAVTVHAAFFAIGFQSIWLGLLTLAGASLIRPLFGLTIDPEDDDRGRRLKRACFLCGSRNWPSKTTSCPLCREDEPEQEEEE